MYNLKEKSMKKAFLILTMIASTMLLSCNSRDGNGTPTSGTWYLETYDSYTCTHGEYIKFRNDELDWNNRLGGRNTTYNCHVSGNNFYLSNEDESISFTIEEYTDSEMVTYSSDDIVRTWRR